MTAEETAAKIISKVGLWWPLAEEDQLRTAAGGYEACSSAIHAAATTGQAGAKLVTGGNTGKAFSAFDDHWDAYHAGLPATAKGCDQVAKALRDFADAVDDAKKKIIDLAIEIGATIAVGIGLAIFSFGSSAAAATARVAMLVSRGLTIATGLTGVANAIVTTILVGAIWGAVDGFITGIVAQVGKMVLNDGPGITFGETMAWTGFGAAGGAVFSGAGLAFRGGAKALAASDKPLFGKIGAALGGNKKPLPVIDVNNLPAHVQKNLANIQAKNSPLPHTKGGGNWANDGSQGAHVLPKYEPNGKPITYTEWDVVPKVKGVPRSGERLVMGSDGSLYYTTDHYVTFVKVPTSSHPHQFRESADLLTPSLGPLAGVSGGSTGSLGGGGSGDPDR